MAEKNLNSRIVHKHDIEVNWSKATNFIPKIGEIIVYDPDENHAAARVKIGDGVKTVVELAFIDDAAKAALFKEIDMVDEKVDALSELVGNTSVQEQIDAEIAEWVGDKTVAEQISAAVAEKADIEHTHSEYVNQNAFGKITVGSTTIAADTAIDTLTLVAGSNVTITPDATNDKVTIAATDTVYTHPTTSGNKHIPSGGSSGQILRWSADGTAVWGADNNTTYSAATTSAAGLMSAADKTKLNGIATGAEVNQNAFSNIVVGSTTIAADSKTDSLTLVAGSNVTLTPDATNDKVTIAAKDTTYSVATGFADGLMSIADKAKLVATNIAYGTCSTAAATAAKVITISGNTNWALAAGSMITVKFTYTNSASNPTFNVNETGAKKVWYNTALITTSNLGYAGTANRPMNFVYDGTQYVFVGWSYDANSTYSNASLGQGYGTCDTAEATVAKVVTLSSYALTTGGIVSVKFTNAVPASATMNINSKGAKAIYYKGAAIPAGIIKAGDVATFIYSTNYHLISIDSVPSLDRLGLTATATELNYIDGVTSSVQTQLNNKAPKSHNQAASTITAGTFAGAVVAQTSSQTPATSLLRNSKLVPEETDPVNNGEICWTYE